MTTVDLGMLRHTISPYRVWNAILVWVSYHLSRITKVNWTIGRPISISIEPTTACNLRCPECPSGLRSFDRPTGNLDQSLHESIIDQVSAHAMYLTLYFQGEPYINPNFFDLVRYAAQNNMIVATSTNAHFLSEENARKTVESGLHRLIISIDGADQTTYEQYRKEGKLEKVLDGARNIVKMKKQLGSKYPKVIFQCLVVAPNEHQLDDIQRLGDEIGVDDVVFKTAQVYDYENGNELIPQDERYSRYKKKSDGTYRIKNKLLNQCWRMWSSCVFTWDGKVVPCCFDKDAKHVVGSISDQSFNEIWKNQAYRKFRSAVLRSRKEIDICANCTEGTKVWA